MQTANVRQELVGQPEHSDRHESSAAPQLEIRRLEINFREESTFQSTIPFPGNSRLDNPPWQAPSTLKVYQDREGTIGGSWVITRAKEYIHEHQTEQMSLGQVAKAVNMSPFYFCKMFKKFTGFNFTNYVSRARIERAKSLLLNENMRVSEIAYQVGFQSLTHFNRIFKRMLGQSPTEYRTQLRGS